MEARNLRKERTGVVVSNKMDKTITVAAKFKEKQSLTDLNFRNYVTTEKDKIQKTAEGQSERKCSKRKPIGFWIIWY